MRKLVIGWALNAAAIVAFFMFWIIVGIAKVDWSVMTYIHGGPR
jgi:hypothetical protein